MTSQSIYYSELSRRQDKYIQPKKPPPWFHLLFWALLTFIILLYGYIRVQRSVNDYLELKYKKSIPIKVKTDSLQKDSLKEIHKNSPKSSVS